MQRLRKRSDAHILWFPRLHFASNRLLAFWLAGSLTLSLWCHKTDGTNFLGKGCFLGGLSNQPKVRYRFLLLLCTGLVLDRRNGWSHDFGRCQYPDSHSSFLYDLRLILHFGSLLGQHFFLYNFAELRFDFEDRLFRF